MKQIIKRYGVDLAVSAVWLTVGAANFYNDVHWSIPFLFIAGGLYLFIRVCRDIQNDVKRGEY